MVLSPVHRDNQVSFDARDPNASRGSFSSSSSSSLPSVPSTWSNPNAARGLTDSHGMAPKSDLAVVPLGKQSAYDPPHHNNFRGGKVVAPEAVVLDNQRIDRIAPPTNPRDHSDDRRPLRHHPKWAQASLFSTTFNLTNTCIGIGALTLPQAVAQCGWILGMIMLAVGALVAYFGLYLQTRSCARLAHNAPSWHTMMSATYPRMRWLADIVVMIQSIGFATFFLVTIGNLIPSAVQGFYAVTHNLDVLDQRVINLPNHMGSRYVWIAIAAAVCVPLSFLPSIHELRWTSVFGIAAVLLLTFTTIFFYAVGDTPSPVPTPTSQVRQNEDPTDLTALAFIPLFIFAYAAHVNTFSAWSELKHHTMSRMNQATSSAMTLTMAIYALITIFAFLTFGPFIPDNFLLGYLGRPLANEGPVLLLNSVRLIMAIHLMTCFPLHAHPFRTSLRDIMANACGRRNDAVRGFTHRLHRNKHPHGRDWPINILCTIPFLLISFGIAFATDNILLFMQMVGATASTMLIFILPGLIFWKLSDPLHVIRRGDNSDASHSLLAGGYPHMACYQNGVVTPGHVDRVAPVVELAPAGNALYDVDGAMPVPVPMVTPGSFASAHYTPGSSVPQRAAPLPPASFVNSSNQLNRGVMGPGSGVSVPIRDDGLVVVNVGEPAYERPICDMPETTPVSKGLRFGALAFAGLGVLFMIFSVIVLALNQAGELYNH